jgi:hypothetical protein
MALLHRPESKELLEVTTLMKHPMRRGLMEILQAELATVQNLMLDVDDKDFGKYRGRGRMLKDLIQFLQDQAKKDSPL